MRYSDRVTLHKVVSRGYNPATGKNEVVVDIGKELPCKKSPTSLEKAVAVFGSIDKEYTTVLLQRPYKDKADVALIGTDKFKVAKHIPYKSESVLYLEGVSEWT